MLVFRDCVEAGARRIICFPFLLVSQEVFSSLQADIIQALTPLSFSHPHVSTTVCKPLGSYPSIFESMHRVILSEDAVMKRTEEGTPASNTLVPPPSSSSSDAIVFRIEDHSLPRQDHEEVVLLNGERVGGGEASGVVVTATEMDSLLLKSSRAADLSGSKGVKVPGKRKKMKGQLHEMDSEAKEEGSESGGRPPSATAPPGEGFLAQHHSSNSLSSSLGL